MMIDRVSPAGGDAAAQSNQAVRLACWAGGGWQRLGGSWPRWSPSVSAAAGGPGRAGGHVLVTMTV